MRRVWLPLLAATASLVAPLAAAGQDYTPSIRPSPFVPLDPAEPGVVTHVLAGDSLDGVITPFPIIFFGDGFNQVNISTFGYLTFSARPGYDERSGGYAYARRSANPYPLPNADAPNGVVAVWWDDLVCPPGSIKTRDAILQGSRTFTVEWNGCYRDGDPTATVQMQVVFTEWSPILRFYYGEIGGGAHDATIGIEDPVRWTMDSSGAWLLASAGGTQGYMPVLDPVCPPTGCGAASWPTNRMIQFGRPSTADLLAAPNASGATGVDVLSVSGAGQVAIELVNNLENGGLTPAEGVLWDYYLSTDETLDPEVDERLDCSRNVPVDVPALASLSVPATCTATVPTGYYRICVQLDPPSDDRPEGAVIEANESNNAYCSEPFAVGAELSGSIPSLPGTAQAGGTLVVPVRVSNTGSVAAGTFALQIWLRDCASANPSADLLVREAALALDAAEVREEEFTVSIPPDAPGTSYCAVLVVDAGDAIAEVDEANNTSSTCVANGTRSPECAVLTRPDLRVRNLGVAFTNGCYYGDPVSLEAEVCNDGIVPARGFGVAFFLDSNSVGTLNDTMIVSSPQACETTADCLDLGGGAPTCVLGICHAPCETDADCGTGGLRCLPSYAIPGNSCQLAIDSLGCTTVRATGTLPTYNIRADREFSDGDIYFSVIADWTDAVAELSESSDNEFIRQQREFCWTRKPDFTPVEVLPPPELAAGEVAPVFHRVRNLGTVGGTYEYRYVLSSNPTVSPSDLALSVEGADGTARADIGPHGAAAGHDLVRVPAGVTPGTYYLGLLVDPDDRVLELLENNNSVLAATPVVVVDSSLRIATTDLRNATVGVDYAVQFLAAGGQGGYTWSLAGGVLPPGLHLEADGLLHGAAEEAGVFLFQVGVTSGSATATRAFALEAIEAHGPLAITLDELPPAFRGLEYQATLSASGGLPPYRWTCPGRPSWLGLQNPLLFGTPNAVADPVGFTCTVADANGTTASREYRLAVYPTSGIRIRTWDLPSGDLGHELEGCLTAEGGSGRYRWSVDPATLPDGVAFEQRDNAGCFTGIPAACGTFPVAVTVADPEGGLTESRRLALTIYCGTLRLTTHQLPAAERGVPYPEIRLESDATSPVVFELAAGELPPGLSLDADGRLAGTVDPGARPGAHEFAVRVRDEAGRSGVGPLAIEVLADPIPTVTITETTSGGCSTAEGTAAPGGWPLAALLALLALRRRPSPRPATALALALATFLLPTAARASTTPGYATYHHPRPYEPLEGATPVELTAADTAFRLVLDGWSVPFFGTSYDALWIHENGLILFSDFNDTTTPKRIPYASVSSPKNFIAGWWDNHTVTEEGTGLRYLIRGTAPNRELVVEWIWKTAPTNDGDDGGRHQVSIFEDGTIAMRWGEIVDSRVMSASHAAVIGLQDETASLRSVPFLACSQATSTTTAASCNSDTWNEELRDTEAVFALLPNLRVRSTSTAAEGFAGLEQSFTATVYNHGPRATTATVRFFVSTDGTYSPDDLPVGTSEPVSVGAFAEREVELVAVLPRELEPSSYFLLAVADPDDAIREFDETDNDGGSFPFAVAEPVPDLAVLRVGAPTSGVPGSTVTVDITVRNEGNRSVADVPFAVVLSFNEVISATDFVLHEGTLTAGWLETVEFAVEIPIPSDTLPGLYHLGVVLDPDLTLEETDKLDNALAAERPFAVTVDGLAVVTVLPRSLEVGAELCIPLLAEGGDGVYTWTLVEGELPEGLALVPGGAEGDAALCGRPTRVGIFDFTLEVTSGQLRARTQMTLEVEAKGFDLEISTQNLPMARFRTVYEAGILAYGGTAPYTWAARGGRLPAGLTLGGDGMVFGTPLEAGTFSLQVEVTDAAGRTATGPVSLLVAPPSRVTCASDTLGTLALGEPFSATLLAAGGEGRLEWTTRSTRRLEGSEGLSLDAEAPPPGLSLGLYGEVSGAPEQVGRYLWTVEVKAVGNGDTDQCPLLLEVIGGQGPSIITTALPPVVPDRDYAVRLQAIHGTGSLQWTLAEGSSLPPGLELDSAGLLSGRTSPAALNGEASRRFAFLVEVRDQQNQMGSKPLSLVVAPEREGTAERIDRTEGEGCQAAGGSLSLAALGLVLLAFGRRR
jgi:MYXO-CTERM domain-containing protein